MVFNMIAAIGFALLLGTTTALKTSPSSTIDGSSSTPSSSSSFDPFEDGRQGNAGARAMLCKKSMDAVHEFAADMMAKAMRTTSADEYSTEAGQGKFTIKPPRVTESEMGQFSYAVSKPSNVESQFHDGRLAANGVWQFKPSNGEMVGGTYEAQIDDLRLNVTNQLVRGNDARPMVKMQRCVADISSIRVVLRGANQKLLVTKIFLVDKAANTSESNDSHVIENCDMEGCVKIRKHYEAHICHMWQGFVDEVINKELQQIPVKMSIHADQYRVDYGLIQREPMMVNESSECIQASMEGKYMWRNANNVPFSPASMEWSNRDRMFSFLLSDYTFNTLFHQAHSSGHRFSASGMSSSSSSSSAATSSSSTPATTTSSTTSSPSTRSRGGDHDDTPSLSLSCDDMESKARRTKSTPKSTSPRSTTLKTSRTSKSSKTKRPSKTTFADETSTAMMSTKSSKSKRTPKTTFHDETSTAAMMSTTSAWESESDSSPSSQGPSNLRKARPSRSTKSSSTRSTTTKSTTSKSTKSHKSSKTSKSTTSTTPKTSPTTSKSSSTTRQRRHGGKHHRALDEEKPSKCLGSLFANASNYGPYEANDTGDIVFKTERPLAIFLGTDKNGSFDVNRGVLEFYGPVGKGQNGQRQLLARAEIRSMRGQFVPKLNKANITGMFKVESLELAQSRVIIARSSSSEGFDLEATAEFSKPWIARMLNTFLERYAQFPVPLPPKYECASPSMTVHQRTMQLDCDIRQQCQSQPACRCFRDSCVCKEPSCEANDPPKGIYKTGKHAKRPAH